MLKRLPKMSLSRLWLAAAVAAAVALNVGLRVSYASRPAIWSQFEQGEVGADGGDYLIIAYTLARTGHFGRATGLTSADVADVAARRSPHLDIPAVEPDAWRHPLWPATLALALRATDYRFPLVLGFKYALDALCVVLFFRLSAHFAQDLRIRALGTLAFAAYPPWVYHSAAILHSEPLSVLVQVGFTLAMLEMARAQSPRWPAVVGSGLIGGAVILTHPFFALYPPLLAVGLARGRRLPWKAAALVVAVATLPPLAWGVRNMVVFDKSLPFLTLSQGNTMDMGWYAGFLADYRNTTADTLPGGIEEPGRLDQMRAMGIDNVSEFQEIISRNYIKENWRMLPALITRKVVGAITPIPEAYRAGAIEACRTIFQVVAFVPLLIVLRARSAGPIHEVAVALISAFLIVAVVTFCGIRFRFVLFWAEMGCIIAVAEMALRRWRRGAGAIG